MNILNKYFEKIIVITSNNTSDRISYVNEHLNSRNIEFEFLYAVDSNYLNPDIVTNHNRWAHKYNQDVISNKNIVSCNLSHIQALKIFLYSSYSNVLILEDDIKINDEFEYDFKLFMDDLPTDWKIINLGRNYTYNDDQTEYYNENVNKIKCIYGSHAYSMSKQIVGSFCEHVETLIHLPYHFDSHLALFYKKYNSFSPSKHLMSALSKHINDHEFKDTIEIFNSSIS